MLNVVRKIILTLLVWCFSTTTTGKSNLSRRAFVNLNQICFDFGLCNVAAYRWDLRCNRAQSPRLSSLQSPNGMRGGQRLDAVTRDPSVGLKPIQRHRKEEAQGSSADCRGIAYLKQWPGVVCSTVFIYSRLPWGLYLWRVFQMYCVSLILARGGPRETKLAWFVRGERSRGDVPSSRENATWS